MNENSESLARRLRDISETGLLGQGTNARIPDLILDLREDTITDAGLLFIEDLIVEFDKRAVEMLDKLRRIESASVVSKKDHDNVKFFISRLENGLILIDWRIANQLVDKYRPAPKSESTFGVADFLKGIKSIDSDKYRNNSFYSSLLPRVYAKLLNGRMPSEKEHPWVLKAIKELAPNQTLIELGLYEEPVEEITTTQHGVRIREKTRDEVVKEIITKIKPYFAGDKAYFTGFAASVSQNTYPLSQKQFDVCNKYISNYQDQFDSNTTGELNRVDAIGEQDEFYRDYSLDYIMFLVEAAKYAVVRSVIRSDEDVDKFITTNGLGPETEMGFDWRMKRRGIVPAKTEKWEKHVVHVHEKLKKACAKGNLEDIAGYVEDPNEFAADPNTALAIVRGDEYTATVVFTQRQRDAAHECMRLLASVCDYAHDDDAQGFNKPDAPVGHKYAEQAELTDAQMPRAIAMCPPPVCNLR